MATFIVRVRSHKNASDKLIGSYIRDAVRNWSAQYNPNELEGRALMTVSQRATVRQLKFTKPKRKARAKHK